ncbi:MAG: sigma-54 dependent transcriptional regulator [Syntrophobacteraceae bacterium]|nr:sigma-54 dependent transcriptional regulator [Syntrophobacteraceae bacterium]
MKVLIIDDELSIREHLEMFLQEKGFEVLSAENGESGIRLLNDQKPDILVLDIRLPGIDGIEVLRRIKKEDIAVSIIMITAFHDMETTIRAMQLGADDYIHKPIDIDELDAVIDKVAGKLRSSSSAEKLLTLTSRDYRADSIVARSRSMREIFKLIGLVSDSRATVLIQGESGTGKELIAKTIHFNSSSGGEPFIPVNCSALVETLLETELFGHEKGSFTGAIYQKKGKIELARNGTIFFDEIGDIGANLQVKLLRFLQEREFERVGGEERIHSGARIIAATNSDLSTMVETHRFREDLYFRLKVVEIHVPPLRERTSDIPLLVEHLLRRITLQLQKNVTKISRETMESLINYKWPGNVRELENVLTRAVVLSKGDTLLKEYLPDLLSGGPPAGPRARGIRPLDDVVRDHVLQALEFTNWEMTKTCGLLKISRPTLRKKILKYQFKKWP